MIYNLSPELLYIVINYCNTKLTLKLRKINWIFNNICLDILNKKVKITTEKVQELIQNNYKNNCNLQIGLELFKQLNINKKYLITRDSIGNILTQINSFVKNNEKVIKLNIDVNINNNYDCGELLVEIVINCLYIFVTIEIYKYDDFTTIKLLIGNQNIFIDDKKSFKLVNNLYKYFNKFATADDLLTYSDDYFHYVIKKIKSDYIINLIEPTLLSNVHVTVGGYPLIKGQNIGIFITKS